jgi:hypothetical protein
MSLKILLNKYREPLITLIYVVSYVSEYVLLCEHSVLKHRLIRSCIIILEKDVW